MNMRIAVIAREKCSPKKCGYLCIKVCPGVRMGDETIVEGEDEFPIISEGLCTGCGICVKKCPYHAITIINLPEELENPLHQYGINAFRVYKIPAPAEGVVGLVGPNGIGKSTLLKILAGTLVPNLGDFAKGDGDWGLVLERYKGHEIQHYLKNVADGKTRLAYKPQEVGKLPDVHKGTVKELLEKTGGNVGEFSKRFELEHCLDKTLAEVSGGDLQRIAIAATMMKDADYYFFDEPSSYLDIRQRLRMAREIRRLGEAKKVFVVEHDLAVLDYLTDYVYVLYGKPGVYGIVSSLKASRTGINEFLDGFLKAENTRIREYPIRFEVKPPSAEWKSIQTISYPGFEKKYPGFTLRIDAGELKRGEVVGILGPNAIGKSTYIKVLAGVEKADSNLNLEAKISYKPQYVSLKGNSVSVADYIADQKIDRELFESEIKRIVWDIMENDLSTLSGGESQRLAIAMALATPCDLCLLDEPSAFLDIEQRFALADLIKRITEKKEVTTLVVDHDIVFQDAIANRIMVFSGEPGEHGVASSPQAMHDGMNSFLQGMNITFRRDPESHRPRVNKPDSQKDAEQKKRGEYYYDL